MGYYIGKKDNKAILVTVSIISLFFLIVFFHHGSWSYYYSVVNPEWNKTKANDEAYNHFLNLSDWP